MKEKIEVGVIVEYGAVYWHVIKVDNKEIRLHRPMGDESVFYSQVYQIEKLKKIGITTEKLERDYVSRSELIGIVSDDLALLKARNKIIDEALQEKKKIWDFIKEKMEEYPVIDRMAISKRNYQVLKQLCGVEE